VSRRSVLLVGRSRSAAAELGGALQAALGCPVELAWRPSVALTVAREQPPGLVLIHLDSLGSDAALLVAQLRAEASTAPIPIVGLSDGAAWARLRLAPPSECDELLTDPADVPGIAASIRLWLETGRRAPEGVAP
jgi:CheY-like chemotaxis protein